MKLFLKLLASFLLIASFARADGLSGSIAPQLGGGIGSTFDGGIARRPNNGGGGNSALMLEDGTSFLLLEDGTSHFCLEGGC